MFSHKIKYSTMIMEKTGEDSRLIIWEDMGHG